MTLYLRVGPPPLGGVRVGSPAWPWIKSGAVAVAAVISWRLRQTLCPVYRVVARPYYRRRAGLALALAPVLAPVLSQRCDNHRLARSLCHGRLVATTAKMEAGSPSAWLIHRGAARTAKQQPEVGRYSHAMAMPARRARSRCHGCANFTG